MNCEQAGIELIAYMDGRASNEQRRAVEVHAQTCPECRARIEDYSNVWSLLEEMAAVGPSLGFDARLRRRAAVEPRPKLWTTLLPAPRMTLAMAALLALSVWMARLPVDIPTARGDNEFRMIRDLNVLEDYDVLSNFDPLSEFPVSVPASTTQPPASTQSGDAKSM
jgi:ferric-dicitrate binding protein FerR (iron transport regulator)